MSKAYLDVSEKRKIAFHMAATFVKYSRLGNATLEKFLYRSALDGYDHL
jgi:hypothetical protein